MKDCCRVERIAVIDWSINKTIRETNMNDELKYLAGRAA